MTELDPAEYFGPQSPCFACGPHHPIGFHLRFSRQDEEIVTSFLPHDRYEGPPGIMHGGLVMTLADEIGAWAVIGLLGKFGFTAAVNGKLLRPVRTGVEVEGRSRLTRETSRVVQVAVRLVQSGAEVFTGELSFVILDEAGAEKMLGAPLPEQWKRFARARREG